MWKLYTNVASTPTLVSWLYINYLEIISNYWTNYFYLKDLNLFFTYLFPRLNMATVWSFHALNDAGIPISLRTGLGYTRKCVILDAAVRNLNLCRRIRPLDCYDLDVVGTIILRIKLGHLDYILSFDVVRHLPTPLVASLGLQFLREERAQVCLSRRILTLQDECEIRLAESHDVRHRCNNRCRCYYLGRDLQAWLRLVSSSS